MDLSKADAEQSQPIFIQGVADVLVVFRGKLKELKEGTLWLEVELASLEEREEGIKGDYYIGQERYEQDTCWTQNVYQWSKGP